jgi:hypothetical protein
MLWLIPAALVVAVMRACETDPNVWRRNIAL